MNVQTGPEENTDVIFFATTTAPRPGKDIVFDIQCPQPVEVTQGGLPPGWAAPIPLPADTQLLGSTRNATGHSVTLFYNPVDAQAAYDAYAKQLLASGQFPDVLQSITLQDYTSQGLLYAWTPAEQASWQGRACGSMGPRGETCLRV